jgi:hypothetical protein
MGLSSWPNDNIRKNDAVVSKNYLGDLEVKELNRLTTILLDIFEDQAAIGRLVMMSDARLLLDRQLESLGRVVLNSGGRVSMADARHHAEQQYARYNAIRKAERQANADRAIAALKRENESLPRERRKRPD